VVSGRELKRKIFPPCSQFDSTGRSRIVPLEKSASVIILKGGKEKMKKERKGDSAS
jgi:hypothetical protein